MATWWVTKNGEGVRLAHDGFALSHLRTELSPIVLNVALHRRPSSSSAPHHKLAFDVRKPAGSVEGWRKSSRISSSTQPSPHTPSTRGSICECLSYYASVSFASAVSLLFASLAFFDSSLHLFMHNSLMMRSMAVGVVVGW